MNVDEMIYIYRYIELRCETKISYDPHSYERNLCNCIWKPEKFRTSTRFF